VSGAGAVAAFAGDTGEEEGWVGVEIVAAVERRTNTADVTVHATGGGGEIEGHSGGGAVGRGHVPEATVGVPVDGRFEEKAVGREKIGAAAAALADVVEELALAVDKRIAGPVEGEEDFAVVVRDIEVDAGRFMSELAGDEVLRGGTAGVGHGGLPVGFVDLQVALGAGLVADISGRRGLGGEK